MLKWKHPCEQIGNINPNEIIRLTDFISRFSNNEKNVTLKFSFGIEAEIPNKKRRIVENNQNTIYVAKGKIRICWWGRENVVVWKLISAFLFSSSHYSMNFYIERFSLYKTTKYIKMVLLRWNKSYNFL